MTEAVAALERCREAEKDQAVFYRALAAAAEAAGAAALADRLQQLHADEQHHFSRLTARLLELGVAPRARAAARNPQPELEGWEQVARTREEAEVRRYEELSALELDPITGSLVAAILDTERHHARELGGKWTMA